MLGYIGRRLLQIIPLLVLLSILIFAIIQLPPGDFVTKQVQTLKMQGTEMAQSQIDNLRNLYNLDKPMYVQYWFWVKNIVTKGDFGWSMAWNKPVTELIRERFATTFVVSILTLLLTWVVAIPIGIYSATHQYSALDYLFTFIGFLGIAVPGFLIALVLLYLVFSKTGVAITGLFSQQYIDAPLTWAKLLDGAKHIWVPVLIIGLSGTGSLIRVTRNMLLDELSKQYVITARSKGVPEGRLLWKYPVRIAINPLISTIGWLLPGHHLGRGARIHRAQHALDRAAHAAGHAEPGHVPGRKLHPGDQRPDRLRYPHLRHSAGLVRSPHPVRDRAGRRLADDGRHRLRRRVAS